MASPDDYEAELPTERELDALLGNGHDPAPGSTAGESRRRVLRVLVVSRRDEDLKTLAELLGEKGVDLSLARNPFTALDYLRARDFQGLITDLSMWADGAALLFERLEVLDRPVPVALIVDRDEVYSWSEDGRVDALLERPLDPERSGRAIGELCARWRRPRESGPEPLSRGREEAAPVEPHELASWHALFFEMRRVSRLARDRDARREIFLQSLLRITGARGVALSTIRVTAGDAGEDVDIRLAADSGGRRELLSVLAELPRDLDSAPAFGGESATLILPVLLLEGTAWLVAIPHEGEHLTSSIPDSVLEELPYLVLEMIGDEGGPRAS